MIKDLRHAVRMLLQAKGWTAVVVLSLALGIGANTALFSAIHGLLLSEMPVKDPDGLVRFRYVGRNDMVTSSSSYGYIAPDPNEVPVRSSFSFPMFKQFVADNKTLSDLFAFAPIGRVNVVVDGQAEIASALISTGNYYQALGVRARLGRTLLPDDDRPDAPPAAVISSKYWNTRFVADPNVVGRSITVNNVPVTIVGVIAPEFTSIQQPLGEAPDVSLPLALDAQLSTSPGPGPARMSQPTYWWLCVMGRLRPGATASQVEGNLGGVFQQTARAGLDSYLQGLSEQERSFAGNQNRKEIPRLRIESGRRGYYDVTRNELRSVRILTGVVVLVLLIVCANVANLLLSRATTRHKELSVRLSLGATRTRLIRQLLTESLLLAGVGGALGILVGYWGRQLLPGSASRLTGMDWRILLFVLVVTGLTGIIFGIAPALRGTGMNVSSALKETGRSVVGARSALGKSLLIVQVAISLVLLVGAGLFLRTLSNLRHVDVGFNPQNLLLFRISPQLNRYDEKRSALLYEQMFERLAAVPGVRGVAMSQPALLTGSVNSTSIYVQGRSYPPGGIRDNSNSINRVVISPNFFEVMQIPLLVGRSFTARDSATSAKVVIINDAAARRYFPNEEPIGRRFGSSVETAAALEVVGVVRDAKYDSIRDSAPPTMYVPYTQSRVGNAVFEVRTAGATSAVTGGLREAVRQIDPNLPMMDVTTQIEQVEMRFAQEKFFAQAYALFGAIALLLASIGLFGLMSYSVSRRTNEIGIRMALGAQRGDVLRLVMRESMVLVVIGIGLGLAAAYGASQYLATLLYGLPPTDVVSIALAVLLMVVVSAIAGFLPARRASRVDPMVALHYE
jgi:predicted permease